MSDGRDDASKALAGLWAWWMQHAISRIRSAVLATRPLQPFAHQDEAVFTHMLPQRRLRYLLADEPGAGQDDHDRDVPNQQRAPGAVLCRGV